MQTKIRDILHGYIPLEEGDELLLESPFIQRLRYIRQNDLAFLVFPALNTTRLEHSLGVMHLAGQLAESALEHAHPAEREDYLDHLYKVIPQECQRSRTEVGGSFRRAARWYGLLHDVGHLPFSHLTEHALKKAVAYRQVDLLKELYGENSGFKKLHEAAGYSVFKDASLRRGFDVDRQAAWMVEQLLGAKAANGVLKPLKDIVDSEVDADRIDSTARDGFLSGGDFGHYDIPRLVQSARIFKWNDSWHTLFSTRAIGPIEGLLMERYKTHRWIHFHPKVLALKNAYQLCISELISALKLPPTYWSKENYFDRDSGFLDDASILQSLWKVNPMSPSTAHAHAASAVLLRTATAHPFWKGTDDFHEICEEVADGDREWRRDNIERLPILNRFGPIDATLLEERLNKTCPEGVSFLVGHVSLTPVELFRPSGDVEASRKSRYYVLERNGKPTPLTHQSGLVLNLPNIIHREPKISVTLLGERDPNDADFPPKKVRDHFTKVAREHLSEIYAARQ